LLPSQPTCELGAGTVFNKPRHAESPPESLSIDKKPASSLFQPSCGDREEIAVMDPELARAPKMSRNLGFNHAAPETPSRIQSIRPEAPPRSVGISSPLRSRLISPKLSFNKPGRFRGRGERPVVATSSITSVRHRSGLERNSGMPRSLHGPGSH